MLTKDEYDMIEDCLDYYSRMLGGAEHVVVVDNGSSHPTVLEVYKRHEARGGTVIVDTRSFKTAVLFMSEHMTKLTHRYDWILPMETDEIVCQLGKPDTVPEDVGAALAAHLEGLPRNVGVVKYGKVLGSLVDPHDGGYTGGAYTRPIQQLTRFYDMEWDKLIVRSAAFKKMTLWCHHAMLEPGYVTHASAVLGLLHFHDTGLRRQVERSKPVVKAYGYFDCDEITNAHLLQENDTLSSIHALREAPIACGHKVKYLSSHCNRIATLRAFKRTLGRLPVDAGEMEKYATNYEHHPATTIRADLLNGSLRRDVKPVKTLTFDHLLYHEKRQDGEKEYVYRVDLAAPAAPAAPAAAPAAPLPTWVTGFIR